MNEQYYFKYLKYKNKYMELKNNNKFGGTLTENIDDIVTNAFNNMGIKNKIEQLIIDVNKTDILNYTNDNKLTLYGNLFTWDNYKYLSDDVKRLIVGFRTDIVNMILNYIFNSFQPCKVSDITICTYKSTGSTGTDASLNSDYDLALSGSYKISDIIRCFNQIFKKLFGGQSSTVFDTNLYGYSYLLPYQSVEAYGNIWTRAIPTDSNSIYVLHEDDGIYKNYDQDKWSYLFLYSFYDKYKDRYILPFTMTLPPDLEEMYKDINIGNYIDTRDNIVKQERYLQSMTDFENYMATLNDNNDDDINTKRRTIIENIAKMHYCADESYITLGTLYHIVGPTYFNKDEDSTVLLKKQYYLVHSMMENLGYFINAYYSHNKDIIYAIKYFGRCVDAYILLYKIFYNTDYNNVIVEEKIDQVNNIAKYIKSQIRGKSNKEIAGIKMKINNLTMEDFENLDEAKNLDVAKNLLTSIYNKNLAIEQKKKVIEKLNEIIKKEYLLFLIELLSDGITRINRQYTYLSCTKYDKFEYKVCLVPDSSVIGIV